MDYETIARLGRGGMGVVDLARDAEGNRVALKRLTLHGSANEIARARHRLMREANVLSRLRHPNIVRLIEVVEDGDEVVLVMPYLSAGNLADRVAQHGPAPPADIERLGERLLGALVAAHQAGVIHRDIKPGNVLYDGDGEPMLADFGLAHSWDQTQGLTVTGMVVGTPGYMPPEQARDEPLTPATDVFALGATLLYAATGVGPYGNGDPGLLMVRAASGEVEPLPKRIPKHMRGWLSSMLDPKPEYRPTAAALLTGHGLPPRRSTRRWLRPRNLVGAAIVAALGVAAWVTIGGGPDDESPSSEDSGESNAGGEGLGSGLEASDDESGARPTETTPDREEPPGDGGELPNGMELLMGETRGRFNDAGETLVYAIPPIPSGSGCDAQVEIHLEVEGPVTAALVILDETGRELDAASSELGEPGSVTVPQDVCAEPGQTLRAELTVADAEISLPDLGDYTLTRSEP